MSIQNLPAHLSNHFKERENQIFKRHSAGIAFIQSSYTRMRLHNFFQSHDDFIRSLIYSNLNKSYIYFISISTSSHMCRERAISIARAVNCKSIPASRCVVKEQRNQFNFKRNCERSWGVITRRIVTISWDVFEIKSGRNF